MLVHHSSSSAVFFLIVFILFTTYIYPDSTPLCQTAGLAHMHMYLEVESYENLFTLSKVVHFFICVLYTCLLLNVKLNVKYSQIYTNKWKDSYSKTYIL